MQRASCWRSALGLVIAAVATPVVVRAQQATTVTGRVTNQAGVGLPGASVYIPELNVGTISRAGGDYTFAVPAARSEGQSVVLRARIIGYTPAEAPIVLGGGTVAQSFALERSALRLDEVVVTGAGTQTTRERLGNVINSVDSALLRRAAEPQNVVSALTAKAPNVLIRTQSGEPGASASIRIRGATSVTGTNQPLFVVDGQPIDNQTNSVNGGNQSTVTQNRAADINPNDIESVEILKGAAAAAIYGARAANGVVLITTKRGRAGPTRYTLQSSAQFDVVDPTIELQRGFGLGAGGVAAVCAPTATNCVPTVGSTPVNVSWGPRLEPGTPTYDHIDEIYDTGLTSDNNLTVSGGNERTTFFLSGGLTGQNGVLVGPNNDYTRTSVRLKATHELQPRLTLGGNFNFVDTRGSYVQKGSNTSGVLLGALRTPPEFDNRPFVDSTSELHRSYRFRNPTEASLTRGRGYDNPFFTLNNPGNNSELGRFIGNVNAEYNPVDWLRVRYTLGGDYYNDTRQEALPLTSSSQPIGLVTRFDNNNLEIDHNLLATATRDFNPNFTGRLSIGQNLNSRRYRSIYAQGQGLVAPRPFALQNTLSVSPPAEFRSTRNIEAYFAQAEADLYDQLFITAGLRNDGFSTFGESDRRANYPKGSVAWTFTRALGIDDGQGPLSFGKLRYSYGETGREPPVYAAISALSVTTQFGSGFGDLINIGQSGQGGLVTGLSLGNTDLRPERNRESEYGIDLGLFNQRVDVGFTYYDKTSTDVILAVPVNAASTGAATQLANAARISNQGIEITLNARPITRDNFSLELGANFGRNNGVVESLAGAEFVPYNTEGFTGAIGSSTVGYAPGVIRGQSFVKCGVTNPEFEVSAGQTVAQACAGARSGALYLAANGLPVVDPDERVIGDPNPDWTAGLTASVGFLRRFRLAGLLDVRRGGDVWNGTRGILYTFGTHEDTGRLRTQTGTFGEFFADEYRGFVGPGADTAAFQSMADWESWFRGQGGGFGDVGAQFIEDGSFVKLRELSLTYTLDQPWLRSRLGLSGADIRVAGRNLATWTDYRGLDPEANLGGAEFLTQGLDYFNNPQTRSFVLSVTLNR